MNTSKTAAASRHLNQQTPEGGSGAKRVRRSYWQGLLSVLVLIALSLPAAPVPAQNTEPVTLNFKDADIDTVIGAFGFLLGRTFIIDPRVRGKITVETPTPVSRGDAYRLLLSALRLQGFTIVSSGRLAKVVPEADAKLQSGPVTAGRQPPTGGDQIVTQVFRLNYESATNLVPVLRPLIAPNNTISAYPNNNSLVITDYANNLQRIARIIGTLDSPSTRQVEVLQVRHGIATDLAITMSDLLDDTQRAGQGAQVDAGQRIVVMAEPNSNTIMIRASSPAKINLAKQLLTQLDRPQKNPGNIHVVYLRNAEAVKLAETLQASLGGNASGSTSASSVKNRTQQATSVLSGAQNSARGQSASLSGGRDSQRLSATQGGSGQSPVTVDTGDAIIAADPTTNSLIITAPEAVYRNLRAVIDQLDTRRAQVFIESLIVEVNAERAAELGVQFQAIDPTNGSTRGIGGTNFTNLDGGGSILSASQNIGNAGAGLNLGIVQGTIDVPGVGEILNLPLLARALETEADGNVLATPNLLTMDNEEARIIIGQNVPFVTGSFSSTGSGGAVNPFQTIERQDVGTTLSVKPQVSESGTVKLQIFQEVSSVVASSIASNIITNRRAIETNVLVDDGQIVVLGGLIEERIEGGVNKVPLLGDIPILGQLFRYDSRKRVKTNLLVFLRPVILRDARASHDVTASRYDYMRNLRGRAALPEHWALPDFEPQSMAPFPPAPSAAKPAPVEKGPAGDQKPALDAAGNVSGDLTRPPGYRQKPGSLAPDVDQFIEQRGGPAPVIDLRQPTRSVPGTPDETGRPGTPVYSPNASVSPSVNPATASREARVILPPRQVVSVNIDNRQVRPAPGSSRTVRQAPAVGATNDNALTSSDAYLN
ncbi:MAG: type II secretion system secretin GspD [Burkholderiaceae bacterium]